MNLKEFSRSLTPPLIWKGLRKLLHFSGITRRKEETKEAPLFDGDSLFFERLGPTSRVYGEYGVGTSTIWMSTNTKARVIGVDTSQEWINHVQNAVGERDIQLEWVDLGEVGPWGRPISYRRRDAIETYLLSPWRRGVTPDLVLIDGRFRVACFLTCLLEASPGVRIIFDDYTNRPHYHVVEEFLAPIEKTQRQALFEVPARIDRDVVSEELERFRFVMD